MNGLNEAICSSSLVIANDGRCKALMYNKQYLNATHTAYRAAPLYFPNEIYWNKTKTVALAAL